MMSSRRSQKNTLDPYSAYHFLAEDEADGCGGTAKVATIFLTASECPLSCSMCDLWRNTLSTPTPQGAIPTQIRAALAQLPKCDWIKLYNSGNFFDKKSVPVADVEEIARLCEGFSRVIVENHPRFMSDRVTDFSQRIEGQLEVAIGLETVEPGMLEKLRKGMDLTDYERTTSQLHDDGIDTRAFVILGLPGGEPLKSVHWAVESASYARSLGVRHVAVIPQRNEFVSQVESQVVADRLSLEVLENAADQLFASHSNATHRQIVTVDLWDSDKMAGCPSCSHARISRMHEMNLWQRKFPAIDCVQCLIA